MSALPQKKVNREEIYQEIVRLIEESSEGEAEISSSELAEMHGVQSPTMDYHLAKLVKEGLLAVSPKRGRFNRKIYRLPADGKKKLKENKPKTEVHKPFENKDSQAKFQEFLNQHKKKQQKDNEVSTNNNSKEITNNNSEKISKHNSEKISKHNSEEISKHNSEEISKHNSEENIISTPEAIKHNPEPVIPDIVPGPKKVINTSNPQDLLEYGIEVKDLVQQELTLDDRIKQFLEDANKVHDANVLLNHEDKEILSVMNETIQQTQVYLKDLSEQLSTIQNKQLIQNLIEDRNRMMKQMERLQQEADDAKAQASNTKDKYEIDENRVRFMHQLIVDSVDQFVKLPNHAMALGRNDFRNKVSKEVKDLVKYVLRLEN